jgi:O-methyltransferase
MYDHPGCISTDLAAVRRYLDGRDIEIVPGDMAAVVSRLA